MTQFSRARALGTAAAAGVIGVPLLTAFVEAATGAASEDLSMLNAAIELERAGIKAYDDAAATNLLSPAVLKVALGFRGDHLAHLTALAAAVRAGGGTPSAATAQLTYPQLQSQADILRFAKAIEEKAASTYLSVIPDFKDSHLAGVAASILGIETTHVAVLAAALGQDRAYSSAFIT